uniref:Uncharacterized protein n=1 Tax=Rhizophora mucronata TaxID=61149 RepID=A0A2P2Q0T3_RHIMU
MASELSLEIRIWSLSLSTEMSKAN